MHLVGPLIFALVRSIVVDDWSVVGDRADGHSPVTAASTYSSWARGEMHRLHQLRVVGLPSLAYPDTVTLKHGGVQGLTCGVALADQPLCDTTYTTPHCGLQGCPSQYFSGSFETHRITPNEHALAVSIMIKSHHFTHAEYARELATAERRPEANKWIQFCPLQQHPLLLTLTLHSTVLNACIVRPDSRQTWAHRRLQMEPPTSVPTSSSSSPMTWASAILVASVQRSGHRTSTNWRVMG